MKTVLQKFYSIFSIGDFGVQRLPVNTEATHIYKICLLCPPRERFSEFSIVRSMLAGTDA
jgi:hypothetical protein